MNTGPQASVVVRLEVTQDDIEQGVEGSCEGCPIARALARAVGGGVSVDGCSMMFYGSRGQGGFFLMNTPLEFSRFMANFDSCGPDAVSPFTYDLTVPAWVVREEAA